MPTPTRSRNFSGIAGSSGAVFRLAHVRFGPTKVVEVATFRRLIVPGTETEPAVVDTPRSAAPALATDGQPSVNLGEGITLTTDTSSDVQPPSSPAARIVHDDNTFGTPEEDAFRRDFTINALFYDIGTLSIIDYTGGIDDLRAASCAASGSERTLPGRSRQDDARARVRGAPRLRC